MRRRPPHAGTVRADHIPGLIADLRGLGMTVKLIAEIVGISRKTLAGYARGANENVPVPLDAALRDCHKKWVVDGDPLHLCVVCYTLATEQIDGLGHFCTDCADNARTVLRKRRSA